ncbi:MAG: tRNA pseudouridine synthase B [Microgenomates group bacterium GW2011_GWC1_37_8]|nr:MAG: tRNA pseudouridine synthase B [Microgenomates group bacterium GW2011_GWC1_37_8]
MMFNLHKPSGPTSHDIVQRVRRITGERKVGHGGTLDPLAEGVLVIGVGRDSTKKLHELLKEAEKEYVATIELGKVSSTDDSEGLLQITGDAMIITKQQIESAINQFTGQIQQTPPRYSAIKIRGIPAYKLARKNADMDLGQRTVEIKKMDLIKFNPPFLTIKVTVSPGTYIRSLARDIGTYLGVGGYLKELTRTRVGDFNLGESISLEQLAKQFKMSNTNVNEG